MGTGPTALQRHVAFFDPGGTGFVTTKQARAGLRRLGVPWIWRIVLPTIICGFLGDRTSRRPFVVSVPQIARGKHPFDTGVFDVAGDFDAGAFEVLFAGRDALTKAEMRAVIAARGDRRPRMGLFAGILGHLVLQPGSAAFLLSRSRYPQMGRRPGRPRRAARDDASVLRRDAAPAARAPPPARRVGVLLPPGLRCPGTRKAGLLKPGALAAGLSGVGRQAVRLFATR